MDEKLNKSAAPPGLVSGIAANMEFYDYWPEPEGADVWSQPGDARWAGALLCQAQSCLPYVCLPQCGFPDVCLLRSCTNTTL